MSDTRLTRRILQVGAAGVRHTLDGVDAAAQQARHVRLLGAVQGAAFRVHADVELAVAPDVALGRRIRISVAPNSRNRLAIAPGCRIGDGVRILLKGGSIALGPRAEVRAGAVLDVSGTFTMGADSVISWDTVIHCAHRVQLAEMAGLAEQVTVADTSHYWTTPEAHFWHNVRAGEVSIGRNTWICPKVTIGRDSRIGDFCLVASNSVVVGEIPDASFASGVPASVRPLAHPWITTNA